MNKTRKNNGFMTVEMLVATSIMVVVILATMNVAQKSIYVASQSFHTTEAGFLLEEGAEAVRVLRDNGWTNLSSLNANTNYYPTFSEETNTWTLSMTPNTTDIFTRTITIANVNRDSMGDISSTGTADSGTKLVTVTVSWMEGANVVSKTLQFYIMNIFS